MPTLEQLTFTLREAACETCATLARAIHNHAANIWQSRADPVAHALARGGHSDALRAWDTHRAEHRRATT